jgi:hypothetical protein
MAYLLAGPLVAIVGIVAVFFVLRRKSVEKRSMYSARRSQIEHKVRAARQRTMAPHGHAPKPAEVAATEVQASPFVDQKQVQPTVAYQAPAYEAPPVAPPPLPPAHPQQAPSSPMPWETTSTPAAPAPASTGWDFPPATAAPSEPAYTPPPPAPEPFRPAPEPTPMPPSEPVWTPAPKPAEPLAPAQTVAPAASSTAAGGWSVVSTSKESADAVAPAGKGSKKRKKDAPQDMSSWQLASGDAPGMEAGDEADVKRPSATIIAMAQYAVLVVGLVMVLVGVLVMVANSHVT